MANKNKNTKKLVEQTDDDPTSEIAIPPDFGNHGGIVEPEIEVDALTFDIDELRPTGRTRADLQDALSEQTRLVEELKFEIEHQRNCQRGLEEELKARAEISATVNSEIKEAQFQLSEAVRTLESRKEEFKASQASLEKANALTERLYDKTRGLAIAAKELKRKIKSLEARLASSEKSSVALETKLRNQQKVTTSPSPHGKSQDKEAFGLRKELRKTYSELGDLRNYIDGRKDIWAKLNAENDSVREQLDTKTEETVRISRDLDERNSQLVRSREQYIAASKQLSQHKTKVRKLNKTVSELQRALDYDARNEIASCRARIAEQSGELAAQLQELSCLREDNSRIEQYSDALRIQLQDQVSISKVSVAMRHKLESGLDAANEMINRLTDQLKKERQLNKSQADTIENVRDEYEREIRQIRFELGAAEDTLAGQETLNGQLASDLVDNKGYREALESQLNEVEKESDKTIRKLTGQLRRARQDADDNARKLIIKDSAIADLMQELSSHTSNIELKSDIENVLQKIDGFKPDRDERSDQNCRERVARLLIGNADGRELRFPLFKDRLTIGRTSQNDIQLDMQYVSRRHAVISTDQGMTRVIDWGSKNGVFVNEKQVTEHILESGDMVTIGTAEFKYEERPKR